MNKTTLALVAMGASLSMAAYAYDYQNAAQLYRQCSNTETTTAMNRCFGYVEGVLATFVSLTSDQLPDDKKARMVALAKKHLNSNDVVAEFRKNYEAGKYGNKTGASFAVVDSVDTIFGRVRK